ncbi:uncharacterized protein [Amphiura filiformis]|uniref:uncharacterized protein n=1 Tax=Amphiura filiformis TaxID=82378 RepID=UPI003B228C6D
MRFVFKDSEMKAKLKHPTILVVSLWLLSHVTLGCVAQGTSPTPEPEPEGTPEPDDEPSTYAEKMPSPAAVLLPPILLIAVIIAGLVFLVIQSWIRRKALQKHVRETYLAQGSVKLHKHPQQIDLEQVIDKDAFLSIKDMRVVKMMHTNCNRPWQLFLIAWPALASLAFCPMVLLMYPVLVEIFWPKDQFPNGPPNINDAIACFLTPAGLVYATSFGFSYQSVLQKQKDLLSIVSHEISLLDQIMILATQITGITVKKRAEIFRLVKAEVVSVIGQLQGLSHMSTVDYKGDLSSGQIWKIAKIFKDLKMNDWPLNETLINEILANMIKLNAASAERYEIMVSKIHPLQWLFLETLGFFSFVGVLLIQASSYRMELGMCIMTVFSISILCYVVSDQDSPFNGFFRVNLKPLVDLIHKAEDWYIMVLNGDDPIEMMSSRLAEKDAAEEVAKNVIEIDTEKLIMSSSLAQKHLALKQSQCDIIQVQSSD